jgi:cobalt-zinc-cadmium efflux system membrane fusion protein
MTNGVGTQKDMEEAQTAYEIAKKEFENAAIGIRIFKADPNKLSLGQALVVRSPIAGEVIENKVVLGQFIKDDASSVATVAELSKIWIVGQVKEKDIRYIHQLADCEIDIAAFPEMHLKGTVYHVNEMVNEETRSVEILITVDNSNHTLKPGMYVTVNFSENPVKSILVPTKAILQMNDASFVFLKISANTYIRKKVVIAETAGENVVLKSSLDEGDTIVSEGGFYLTDTK